MLNLGIYLAAFGQLFLSRIWANYRFNGIKNALGAQDIEPIHISILTEVGVRDKYIYSRLKSDFEGNLKKLAYNQCKNNQITQLQLTRLQSRIHSTNLEVFSIHPNTGKFIVALGEAMFHFSCSKVLLRPIFIDNGKCFNNLAVKRLQKIFYTNQ